MEFIHLNFFQNNLPITYTYHHDLQIRKALNLELPWDSVQKKDIPVTVPGIELFQKPEFFLFTLLDV